jgi:multidrug resistance efflux pump
MNPSQNINDFIYSLPEVEIKKSFPIRFINKAVSITFLIIVSVFIIAALVIYSVNTIISINAQGVLIPGKIVHIHSAQNGIIKNVLIKSGDTVNIGRQLVILDSLELKKSLFDIQTRIAADKNTYDQKIKKAAYDKGENEISLENAEIQLVKAKASFRDRISGYYPNADLDSIFNNYTPGKNISIDYAVTDVRSAEMAIKLNKLNIRMQEMLKYDLNQLQIDMKNLSEQKMIILEKLNQLIIKSPVSGIILNENVENLVNSYVTEGTELLNIAETKDWEAVLFVTENDIHQVKVNDKVRIKLGALQSTGSYTLYNAEVASIGAEKITAKDNYSNFAGRYRVSVRLQFDDNNKSDLSKLKYDYNVDGEIITDSGKIADLLKKYFRKLL